MSILLTLLAFTALFAVVALRARGRAAGLRKSVAARDAEIVALRASKFELSRQLQAHDPSTRRRSDWVDYIRTYEFPDGMLQRALDACPAGTDAVLVERGLREFLATIGAAPKGQVAMCSTTVDEAWHTFITYTRDYAAFCDAAFGGFRHHVPQDPTAVPASGGTGVDLVSAWLGACAFENLDPLDASSAPALFASDEVAGLGARAITGTCGAAALDADTACVATEGQVCLVHQYASAFETLTSAGVFDVLVPGRAYGASSARPKSTRRRAALSGRSRSKSAAATSGTTTDSGYLSSVLAYHAVMAPPVEDCSSATSAASSSSTSSSYSSCGSSSSYSSCSSSSGSSCSSSSCGSC